MRRFVVIGRTATASPDFLLADLPGTSGRLDVLLRCVRAALLVSHGVRRDTFIYLVLLGGGAAPKVVRVDGTASRYVRPDERSLATTLQKALRIELPGDGFVEARNGIAVARGGLSAVLADLPKTAPFVLEAGGADVRSAPLVGDDLTFFVGDHLGFDDATRAELAAIGCAPLCLGPVSVHADDAIAVVCNELDRGGQ